MVRRVRTGCWRVLAALVRRLPVCAPGDGRQVLLVLRPDAIGDYILFRPWLRWLREASPWAGWRIVLAGNQVWRDMADEFDADCFDEAIWIERRRLMRSPVFFFRVARRLRRFGTDLLLYPVISRELSGDLLVRASGARQAIAAECDGINLDPQSARRTDRWYTRLVPVASRGFEFDRTLGFFSALCGGERADFPRDTGFPVSTRDAGPSPVRYVMLFPGAGDPRRCWPAESWSRVGGLCRALGYRVLVCGSRAERPLCERIALDSGAEVLDGPTGWRDLAVRLAGASLALCHDSMALHLAVACHVPVICIGNGNHYGRFVPYPETLRTAPLVLLVPPKVLAQPDPESVFSHGSAEDISGVDFEVVARATRTLLGSVP